MALSYPLTFPAVSVPINIEFRSISIVGGDPSPFTAETQLYAHAGAWREADVTLPPMKSNATDTSEAEDVVAMLEGLNGREGTFLMGPGSVIAPRGTWAGSPKVLGAHAAGARTVAMDGFTAAATVKNGDWFQSGTGSVSRLHKVTKDATADGSGLLTLEIWPPLREALADNDTFDTSSPVGCWRLLSNERSWSIGGAGIYGISFSCRDAI